MTKKASINEMSKTGKQWDEPCEISKRKKCFKFASIAFHLQIKTAEKMDYLDQMECQLSSKSGKEIVNLSKHKATIKVDEIEVVQSADDISIFINTLRHRGGKKLYFSWAELRHKSIYLPRFTLSSLAIYNEGLLSHISEIEEKAGFVKNTLDLKCDLGHRNSIQRFTELTDIFTIEEFQGACNDPAFFDLIKFQKIPTMRVYPFGIPDEALLQLEASELTLPLGTTGSFLNCFLQQWFRGERDIKWLELWRVPTLDAETLFCDIPFSHIVQCEDGKEGHNFWVVDRSSKPSEIKACVVYKGGFICTVDRGDKKLLVIFHSGWMERVIAQEYYVLEDIFGIKRRDIKRID